uniref:EOG090X017N n=1 Tax=Daphnia pulex TaxID=6669 RepID=A0A4Y7MVN3_DAPPU|nr:EOG090X017N [Daphnia pulex]SVE84707.1 EOG090X017N [Daphnia pulex]
MRLFWQIIVLSAVLLEAGKERALAASNAAIVNDNGSAGRQVAPTSTKTVYGFLDFTTIVSDTMMIFKPSKSGGNKARNAFASPRTASVVLNKFNKPGPVNGHRAKVEASQPVPLESSATVQLSEERDDDEQSRGRSGNGRFKPSRPRQTTTPSNVHIEGSLVNFEDPSGSSQSTPRGKAALTERLKVPRRQTISLEGKGPDPVVPSYSVIKSHVDVSSRVDIHIGGLPKQVQSGSSAGSRFLPKQVEVRMEVNLSPPTKKSATTTTAASLPAGQSLVSKTVGTRIQNGMTTIHETSVIGTTIDGQYAHFVQSTSTVFQEPTATVDALPPGRSGSVEVVTDKAMTVSVAKPKITKPGSGPSKPMTEAEDKAHFASLPSLESLFESVSGPVTTKPEEELPKAEPQVSRQNIPTVSIQEEVTPPAVQHKSHSSPPVVPRPSNSLNLERRAGLASSPRLRDATPRPQRPDEQRWRYSPTPKPKVAIQRTSNASGSRFRERLANPGSNSQPSRDSEAEELSSSVSQNYQEPESPDPTEVITLRVQSVTPEGYSNLYYEIATIKSPYIMRLGAVRNTRFVTLTRSYTRLITPTPPPASVATLMDDSDYSLPEYEPEALLEPSQPLPDPENILATTTPYEQILKESSDTATLPAIIVAATEVTNDYTMQTVTETFSTTELMLKTSILPYQRAGTTSHMTLTQSYYITRVVVAVKTVPPEDLYQFIPSKKLTDISTNLQEAGSEHNVRLLPGELEFSENDEYSDQEDDGHRNEKRVPAPQDYPTDSDLSSIGQEFDLSSVDRPSAQVDLEPSLVDPAGEFTTRAGTPPLPNSFQQLEPSINVPQQFPTGQETPMLSPEQLQQLALFRYMNPYAAAGLPFGYPGLPGYGGANGGGQPQVITTSKPVVRTLDVIRTETVPIWNGVTTIYSTITRTKGTTVVTETEYGTQTIAAPLNPLFPGQQYTIVSSPVVTEVTTTSTELRIYRIIFRAQTTYTTVTSTTVFPTMVTTYVSSTVAIQPTAFPAGLFPGSYPYAAFG